MTYIYGLWDPRDGRLRYIGKSNNPKIRLSGHISKSSIKFTSHRAAWIKKLLDEGLKPLLEVLEEVSDDEWEESEKDWIKQAKALGLDLVNSCDGGNGSHGRILTQEHKDNIRKALIGKKRGPPTQETRFKLSQSHKGEKKKPVSPETREKLRQANLGKTASEETKAKMSKALKGKPHLLTEAGRLKIVESNKRQAWTPERKQRLSKSIKGCKRGPMSEERRRNISKALKGRRYSEETLKKMSEAHKGENRPRDERGRFV